MRTDHTHTGTALFRTSNIIVLAAAAVLIQASGIVRAQPAPEPAAPANATATLPAHKTVPATGAELFNDRPSEDGGWKALANVLDKLTPSVDTSIPLTPSQITDRIETMINQGRYDDALEVVELRKLQREQQGLMGVDVQLLFLEGRALSESGRGDEAIAVYRDMTVHYPELPEPWNNLSAEYVRQNRLDMAEQALLTALTINPDYATARLNLGIVQLMQAHDSFKQASRLGIAEAGTLSDKTASILQP